MVFPKNSRLNMIFFVISGKMVFLFSRKYIFSLGENERRWSLSKNTWKYDIFCIYALALQAWHCSLAKKTKMPRKNTPKGDISGITEKDDIHSRFTLDSSYFCWNTTFIYTLQRAQEATGDVQQEKVFLEISQNSKGNTCARASFLIKLQTYDLQVY